MGIAMEVITGRVLNPGATITAATAGTGDSFTIKAFPFDSPAYLENVWALSATAGVVRVRSPRMHDNVQGLRLRVPSNTNRALLPDGVGERMYPQDTLIVEQSGGGAETDSVGLMLWYSNLPGVEARLANWSEIAPRIQHILTVETNNTSGGTPGDYGGGLALNANFDLLVADTDYALLGYECDVLGTTVGIRGPDTGNLRVGGPCANERIETRDWFVSQANATGRPHIPILNSANKAATTVDLVNNTGAIAINVSLILAQLARA